MKTVIQSRLVRGSAIVLAVRLVNVAVAFGLSVLLLRRLGLQDFGAYATYMAIMGLAVLPMTAGLPNLIVREAAPAFSGGNRDLVRGVVAFTLRIVWRYLIVLTAVIVLLWLAAPDWLSVPLLGLLWIHALFQILAALRSALLRAAGHVVRGQLLERLVQPVLTLGFTAAGAIWLGEAFAVFDAVSALLAAHVIVFVWGGIWVRRFAISHGPKSTVDRERLWSEGLNLSGSGFLSSLMMHGIVLLTGALASLEATGLYRIAAAVAQPMIYFHEVLEQVISPRLAQHWHKRNLTALTRILHVGVVGSIGIVGLSLVILLFFGRPVLNWAYGEASLAAYSALLVLSLGHVANASGGFAYSFLNMSGNAYAAFRARLMLTPIMFAVSLPAIVLFGAMGAASALAAYQVSIAIWLGRRTVRATGIDPTILGAIRSANTRFLRG